jgi:hypothetical protein
MTRGGRFSRVHPESFTQSSERVNEFATQLAAGRLDLSCCRAFFGTVLERVDRAVQKDF